MNCNRKTCQTTNNKKKHSQKTGFSCFYVQHRGNEARELHLLLTSQNITSFKWEEEKCNTFLTFFSLWSTDMKTEPISTYLPEVIMKLLNVRVGCFIRKEEWLFSWGFFTPLKMLLYLRVIRTSSCSYDDLMILCRFTFFAFADKITFALKSSLLPSHHLFSFACPVYLPHCLTFSWLPSTAW